MDEEDWTMAELVPTTDIPIIKRKPLQQKREVIHKCQICLDFAEDALICKECGAYFCKTCIYSWIVLQQTCPHCRYMTPVEDYIQSTVIKKDRGRN